MKIYIKRQSNYILSTALISDDTELNVFFEVYSDSKMTTKSSVTIPKIRCKNTLTSCRDAILKKFNAMPESTANKLKNSVVICIATPGGSINELCFIRGTISNITYCRPQREEDDKPFTDCDVNLNREYGGSN